MSDTRLLLEITPKGILSFGDETMPIKLSSLNVLIGTNGSRKSNLIDVIGLLRATAGDLEGELIENGGLEEWFWKGSKRPTFVLETKTGGIFSARHLLEIFTVKSVGSFQINREEIESFDFGSENSEDTYLVCALPKN